MKLGKIETFPNVNPDKAQVTKILEEAAEVFSAWEKWRSESSKVGYFQARSYGMCQSFRNMVDECADVIMATCNLLASLDINNFEYVMEECVNRNRERGRYDVQEQPDDKRKKA